jgi:nucleotide-binding universal stress UspA family protein
MESISRILVPVDFSQCSLAASDWAALLAKRFGATVDVLHVWNPQSYSTWAPYYPVGVDDRLFEFERDEAGGAMKQILAHLEESDLTVHGRLNDGDPLKTILRIAAEGDYDLIVMGTHGQTGMTHRLLGGLAEAVVRRASCPVLTIRHSNEAKRELSTDEEVTPLPPHAGAGR